MLNMKQAFVGSGVTVPVTLSSSALCVCALHQDKFTDIVPTSGHSFAHFPWAASPVKHAPAHTCMLHRLCPMHVCECLCCMWRLMFTEEVMALMYVLSVTLPMGVFNVFWNVPYSEHLSRLGTIYKSYLFHSCSASLHHVVCHGGYNWWEECMKLYKAWQTDPLLSDDIWIRTVALPLGFKSENATPLPKPNLWVSLVTQTGSTRAVVCALSRDVLLLWQPRAVSRLLLCYQVCWALWWLTVCPVLDSW